MATTASPNGLRPVGLIGGRPYNQGTRMIPISSAYGTAIYNGDVVKIAGGYIAKDTGTTSATPVGVFLGCEYTDATLGRVFRQYWPASQATVSGTTSYAVVCDDPNAVFQIQSDEAVAQTALGKNAALVQTAGSTATGDSKVALDGSTVATTNTLPLRIVGFVDGPFSTVGDAYTDVLVTWNAGMHQYNNATGAS